MISDEMFRNFINDPPYQAISGLAPQTRARLFNYLKHQNTRRLQPPTLRAQKSSFVIVPMASARSIRAFV